MLSSYIVVAAREFFYWMLDLDLCECFIVMEVCEYFVFWDVEECMEVVWEIFDWCIVNFFLEKDEVDFA